MKLVFFIGGMITGLLCHNNVADIINEHGDPIKCIKNVVFAADSSGGFCYYTGDGCSFKCKSPTYEEKHRKSK